MFKKRKKPLAPVSKPVNEEDNTGAEEDNTGAEQDVGSSRATKARGVVVVTPPPAEEEEGKFEEERFEATLEAQTEDPHKLFVEYDVDTEHTHDARAILERNIDIGRKLLAGELEKGVYRGKSAYAPVANMREGAVSANKYTGLYGPLRASKFSRITSRVDYNPEICKDYNETGYCGFGDTCKFIHDRYDYKSGWQIDKEWEAKQKKRQQQQVNRMRGIKPGKESDSDSD